MEGSEEFKTIIQDYLKQVAATDAEFAEKFADPEKKIDDCITYIVNEVKKAKRVAWTNDEIFGKARHYYDEAKVAVGPKTGSGRIVSTADTAPKKPVEKQVPEGPVIVQGDLFA